MNKLKAIFGGGNNNNSSGNSKKQSHSKTVGTSETNRDKNTKMASMESKLRNLTVSGSPRSAEMDYAFGGDAVPRQQVGDDSVRVDEQVFLDEGGEFPAEQLVENSGSFSSSMSVSSACSSDMILSDEATDDVPITETAINGPSSFFNEQEEITDYFLVDKIGEGAFSRVFRAKPVGDSFLAKNYKEVAIKVIKKDHLTPVATATTAAGGAGNTEKLSTKEQVLKEVTLHKIVSGNCPNVVKFIDFKETRSYYYIVQELLKGGEIFNVIVKFTYFSEDLSRHIIRQLGVAVKHLHSIGIVHRDIKPENLLYEPIKYIANPHPKLRESDDPNTKLDEGVFILGVGSGGIGTVKLTDFGLSKQIYHDNTKTPCGTVGYTAPEVVKDERYSMQVDLWGIGCVLYTMLCGFPPFYDDKIDVLTEKISRGEYTFLSPWWDEISDGAKNCVRNLLEVNPEKRYDIDEFLADPWLNKYDSEVNLKSRKKSRVPVVPERSKIRKSSTHKKKMMQMFRNEDPSILYSPAAVVMRDAFDVSNAVQRIEEAKKLSPRARHANLYSLNEEEDEEGLDDKMQFNEELESHNLNEQNFPLSLNASTIVQRRKEKQGKLMDNMVAEVVSV
ncbi:serine/threonine protein kinase RCK2 KNAG_0I01360 [Huiozyma naganishii CBS 8797]|uniref:non-specific serine/threonine protein kinase n=1 Tax=Huiozyma naganishii (strain ATCC MYA-139 / BCRC 22969 / CBS 8797 / KCTC 17520 / NBRC 10181 / NCYC 3082 / Yp74L-3) TaxID=1071383 RepID=J7SA56_HUIN7|nr:hypothetical protein KNAG_0I01360 [Kazachstania naganishii CBS 8797]CCK71926.1 hypothetical protein KNAG_0I01360 [Kazachstania naganishii CBS 8797]